MIGLRLHLYSFDEYYYSYAPVGTLGEHGRVTDAIAQIYDLPLFWDKKAWFHEVFDGAVATVYAFARREDEVSPDEIQRWAGAIPPNLPLAYHSVGFKFSDSSVHFTLDKRTQRVNNEKRKKLLASVGETLLQRMACYDRIK